MLRINNFRVPLTVETPLDRLAAKRLKLPRGAVIKTDIVRRALDARRKNNISFVYSLDVEVNVPEGQVLSYLGRDKDIAVAPKVFAEEYILGQEELEHPPVVVGAGPAGLLAALTLAKQGFKPVLLERGRDVDKRTGDIAAFWNGGAFDPCSNVQFGEGGAGTFSDGKLTTRVSDSRMGQVLDVFITHGAPPEIKYVHKPHIGTDKLRTMVRNIRKEIIALGGTVEFEARVTDIKVVDGVLKGIIVNENRYIPCNAALLAIGHSARDTYQMLHDKGVAMEAKPFAIGVRIEHPQEMIDTAQYGPMAGHPSLGAADYALVYHDKETERTAYSFCMCPGGQVVAAASEAGGVVTNGMSLFSRASGIANSALVVNVSPADCGSGVLAGMAFQRHYEHLAFIEGQESYQAPAVTVGDFLSGRKGSTDYLVNPSYRPGVVPGEMKNCLPSFVTETLAKALPEFGRRIRGFDHPGAVMTGVETRTSAPVRILRNNHFVSLNIEGLYPVGEGAGYAGGIMSAALDGLNAAIMLVKKYKV